MTKIWMRHITHMKLCGYDSFIFSWFGWCTRTHHMCDMKFQKKKMTHSCVGNDSFICVTWLNEYTIAGAGVYLHDLTHAHVFHDSSICVTWLIHRCDMTHSYVWHDSFICVTWLIHMCDMTHSYAWNDAFICGTWFIQMCDMILVIYNGRCCIMQRTLRVV